MILRRFIAAAALLCAVSPAYAQKTKAQLSQEITLTFPDQTQGAITPSSMRSFQNDFINSIMPTAPVVSGNLVCWNGTTGLLQDCGSSPITAPIAVGTTPITGGQTTRVLYDSAGVVGEYTSAQLIALINPLPLTNLPTGSQDTALGYWGSTAASALAIGNCSNSLTYSTSTHAFGCNTSAGTGTVTSVATAGLASGGPITSTGTVTVTAAAKTDQQTPTSNVLAVTPLHQQDHPSAAKMWAFISPTGGVQASYNLASASKSSTGNFTFTFSTAFSSANYSCQTTTVGNGAGFLSNVFSKSTVSIGVETFNLSGSSADPTAGLDVVCYGGQ